VIDIDDDPSPSHHPRKTTSQNVPSITVHDDEPADMRVADLRQQTTDPQSRLFSKLGASEGLLKENSSEFQGDSPTDSKVGLRSKLVAMTVGGSSEKTQFAAKASGRRALFLAALGIGVLLGLLPSQDELNLALESRGFIA